MKILVTGACGYKGHILVPKLLKRGYFVVALDLQWFGNFMPDHERLTLIKERGGTSFITIQIHNKRGLWLAVMSWLLRTA